MSLPRGAVGRSVFCDCGIMCFIGKTLVCYPYTVFKVIVQTDRGWYPVVGVS